MILDRSRWREIINKDVHIHKNIKSIVDEYKQCAIERRKVELTVSMGVAKRKITEISMKENNPGDSIRQSDPIGTYRRF
jgi:hypothetical protein